MMLKVSKLSINFYRFCKIVRAAHRGRIYGCRFPVCWLPIELDEIYVVGKAVEQIWPHTTDTVLACSPLISRVPRIFGLNCGRFWSNSFDEETKCDETHLRLASEAGCCWHRASLIRAGPMLGPRHSLLSPKRSPRDLIILLEHPISEFSIHTQRTVGSAQLFLLHVSYLLHQNSSCDF